MQSSPASLSSFTSQRTTIDPLTLSDSTFILKLVNTKGWLENIGDRNIHDESDAANYIHKILNNANTKYWVVRIKESQDPIGILTLILRDQLDYHDFGFAFLPEYNNKGFAFEASKVILEALLNSGDFPAIIAITIPQNTASVRLLSKLNFNFEKEITYNNEVLRQYKTSRTGI